MTNIVKTALDELSEKDVFIKVFISIFNFWQVVHDKESKKIIQYPFLAGKSGF